MSLEIIGIDIVKQVGDAQQLFYDENFRTVVGDILTLMKTRVHKDGKNSAGAAFSTYSKGYLRIRACNNRGVSPKKIMSLTRELENAYGLIRNGKGWAIGLISGAGKGGEVGFRISCIKKKQKDPAKKSKYIRTRVEKPPGKTRKVISNAEKLEFQEAREGPFMTKLSKEEQDFFDKRIQDAWNASLENKKL
jgi:hypothetical protein